MSQSRRADWPHGATVIVAASGVLLALAVYGFVCATAEVSVPRRLLGFLLMSAWSTAPYLGALWAAQRLSPHRLASVIVLFGTTGIVAFAVYVVVQATILYPHDGQSGFALVLLPFCQLLFLGFTIAGATLTSWYFNRH
jgi:hypothetical protein